MTGNMTAAPNSNRGVKIKLILLRTKIFNPISKATRKTVMALLSTNHLKNQDKLKSFSLCSTGISFVFNLFLF